MKRFTFLTVITIVAVVFVVSSCKDKRDPGRIYMPDMTYSRAVETYALLDSTIFTDDSAEAGEKIFYNRKTVLGTIKRGELFPYTIPNDSNGYKLSATIKNPLPPLTTADSAEASRLFNINCAICHGADGKADGPLADKIGGVANLTSPAYVALADGTMFHSINYGKNNMGSYASQLDSRQRWMIIQYIRKALQPQPNQSAGGATADSTNTKK
jgi:mono/diheme cytochrome c family protein